MKTKYNNQALQKIRTLQELNYQRRLLTSRIEQQEVMVSYKIQSLKKAWSPVTLIQRGCENLAVRRPFFNAFMKAFNWTRSLKYKKASKQ